MVSARLQISAAITLARPLTGLFAASVELLAPSPSHPSIARPIYQAEHGRFILDDGERVDGVWLVPEEDRADTPVIVERRED